MNVINKVIQKYCNLSVEKKSAFWYMLCNVVQKAIGFVTIPIITRLLSTSEYGNYSVFLSWKELLMIFTTLSLYSGFHTKLIVDFKDKQDECTSCVQCLGSFITLLFFGAYLLFRKYINILLGYDTFTIIVLFLYYFFYPSYLLWCTKLRVNYKYIPIVISTVVLSIITPLGSILLIIFTNLRSEALILCELIIHTVVGCYFFVNNLILGKKMYEKKIWLQALSYNIPLIPHNLSLIVLSLSDRLMISYYKGDAEAGLYNLGYQISQMMNIIFNAINGAFIPKSYEYMKSGKVDNYKIYVSKLVGFALILTIIAVFIGPEMVFAMGGQKYLAAIYVIPSVCMSVFIKYFYSFFSAIEFYFAKTKSIMIASTMGAIINIVLNAIYIPRFGFVAAGYTTLAGYLFLFLFHYYLGNKIFKIRFNQVPLGKEKLLIYTLLAIFMSVIIPHIYKSNSIVRYLLLLLTILFALYMGKKEKYN